VASATPRAKDMRRMQLRGAGVVDDTPARAFAPVSTPPTAVPHPRDYDRRRHSLDGLPPGAATATAGVPPPAADDGATDGAIDGAQQTDHVPPHHAAADVGSRTPPRPRTFSALGRRKRLPPPLTVPRPQPHVDPWGWVEGHDDQEAAAMRWIEVLVHEWPRASRAKQLALCFRALKDVFRRVEPSPGVLSRLRHVLLRSVYWEVPHLVALDDTGTPLPMQPNVVAQVVAFPDAATSLRQHMKHLPLAEEALESARRVIPHVFASSSSSSDDNGVEDATTHRRRLRGHSAAPSELQLLHVTRLDLEACILRALMYVCGVGGV